MTPAYSGVVSSRIQQDRKENTKMASLWLLHILGLSVGVPVNLRRVFSRLLLFFLGQNRLLFLFMCILESFLRCWLSLRTAIKRVSFSTNSTLEDLAGFWMYLCRVFLRTFSTTDCSTGSRTVLGIESLADSADCQNADHLGEDSKGSLSFSGLNKVKPDKLWHSAW